MSFSRVAILKPDHLGDLVLSIPAVRQIQRYARDATLFCHPACMGLARTLFPGLALAPISFPHLQKSSGKPEPFGGLPTGFDLWLSLRSDPGVNGWLCEPALTFAGSFEEHESSLQRKLVRKAFGDFSRTALFFEEGGIFGERPFPAQPKRVGLCVSAGFSTNAWSAKQWLELQRILARGGITTTWIGGPAESGLLQWLQRMTPGASAQFVLGSSDFDSFWRQVAELDLVIATDSGTAHLCSRVVPLLSLFGPSPFKRYAPFGKNNRLLTLALPCSPCPQFSKDEINTCLTRECLYAIPAHAVAEALMLPHQGPRRALELGAGVQVWDGVSHLPSSQ